MVPAGLGRMWLSVSAFLWHSAMPRATGPTAFATGKTGRGNGLPTGLVWDLEFQGAAHWHRLGEWPGAASTVLPPLWGHRARGDVDDVCVTAERSAEWCWWSEHPHLQLLDQVGPSG